jgi:hypothetical protein
VLLKNAGGLPPLSGAAVKSIAVVGHASGDDVWRSAQVDAPGRPSAGWQAWVFCRHPR